MDQKPSIEEEEAIKARSATQPKKTKKIRKKTRKRNPNGDVEQRGRGTRRNVENGMTQKDKKKKEYKADLNGCTHGD